MEEAVKRIYHQKYKKSNLTKPYNMNKTPRKLQ